MTRVRYQASGRTSTSACILAVTILLGCGRTGRTAGSDAGSSIPPLEEPPPKTPDGLLAEAALRGPDGLLAGLSADGEMPLLAEGSSSLLRSILHVGAEVARTLDGGRPLRIAWVSRSFVMAVPVRSEEEVESALLHEGLQAERATAGSSASALPPGPPPGRRDRARIFRPSIEGRGPRSQVLGVLDGHLVAASDVETIRLVGPWLIRASLPTLDHDVTIHVTGVALRGILRAQLATLLETSVSRRRAMLARAAQLDARPFGLPAALLDLVAERTATSGREIVESLGEVEDAIVWADVRAGALVANVDLTSHKARLFGAVAAGETVDLGSWLPVNKHTVVAVAGRSGEPTPQRTAWIRELLDVWTSAKDTSPSADDPPSATSRQKALDTASRGLSQWSGMLAGWLDQEAAHRPRVFVRLGGTDRHEREATEVAEAGGQSSATPRSEESDAAPKPIPSSRRTFGALWKLPAFRHGLSTSPLKDPRHSSRPPIELFDLGKTSSIDRLAMPLVRGPLEKPQPEAPTALLVELATLEERGDRLVSASWEHHGVLEHWPRPSFEVWPPTVLGDDPPLSTRALGAIVFSPSRLLSFVANAPWRPAEGSDHVWLMLGARQDKVQLRLTMPRQATSRISRWLSGG